MAHSNIRREEDGNRFHIETGCRGVDFIREVLFLMQQRSFPVRPFKAVCVFCETSALEIEIDETDDLESAVRKYHLEYDELCRAYGDDV